MFNNTKRHAIHKTLGTNVNTAATWQEAIQLGGLDWNVETRPLHTPQGNPIPNNFGVFRTDKENDAEGFLGAVKGRYTTIQNAEAFEFADDIINAGERSTAFYESVGAVGKGERVFALINLGKSFSTVEGDSYDSYLCLTTSHDGNSSGRAFIIILRGACQNTIPARMRKGGNEADGIFKMRHTKKVLERMQRAKEFLTGAAQSVEDVQRNLKELAQRDLRRETSEEILDRLFPKPSEQAAKSSHTMVENRRSLFMELFESNDNDSVKLIRGTALNAYNAYTEMVDHEVSVVLSTAKSGMTREEVRAERALFGSGALEKEKALDVILSATSNAPRVNGERSYSFSHNPSNLLDSILDAQVVH